MNEEEFIKEHPSLRGNIRYLGTGQLLDDCICKLRVIHETQIDKQKVEEAIIDFNSTPNVWLDPLVSQKAFTKLLKRLGLK